MKTKVKVLWVKVTKLTKECADERSPRNEIEQMHNHKLEFLDNLIIS